MKIAFESFYFGILVPINGHRERKEQVQGFRSSQVCEIVEAGLGSV